MTSFQDFGLADPIARALREENYLTPTPIQAQTIPLALAGRDVVGIAQTGTGKTASFALPILHRLLENRVRPQPKSCRVLVLSPTRELSGQILDSFNTYGRHIRLSSTLAIGGVPMGRQVRSLMQGVEVLVATPGRLLDLVQSNGLKLNQVEFLVLDEADRMLDMGFEEPIREIAGRTHKDRQSLLFSATFPDSIRAMARDLLRDAVEVTVEGADQAPAIRHVFCEVEPAHRQKALAGLLLKYTPESAVVFCNTRKDVDEVANSLQQFGFSALALHGDMEQRDREEVLLLLANRSCNVLVASDVAARGLDVEELAAVINYELPTDVESYQHRVGRTGRAGASGLAISLVAGREKTRAEAIEAQRGEPLDWQKTPLATSRPAELPQAAMRTLRIDGGKTDKLRAGDILGALTGDAGLSAKFIGKIAIFPTRSYVAIAREQANKAVAKLEAGKIKGRRFRVRMM